MIAIIAKTLGEFQGSGKSNKGFEPNKEKQQYHIALFVDPSIVGPHRHSKGAEPVSGQLIFGISGKDTYYWGAIDSTKSPNPGRGLLGSMVLLPNSKLVKEVVDMNSVNKELSHPIIDYRGNIRMPSVDQIMKLLQKD